MSLPNERGVFRVKEPSICHELVDGEVVAVDFVTGNYYSLMGSAARIWSVLSGGASIAQVWSRLGLEGGEARQHAAEFVGQLLAEGLLEETGTEAAGTGGEAAPAAGEFERPVLEKFSDMQELLLADPLHDVDEHGWPSLKPNPSA